MVLIYLGLTVFWGLFSLIYEQFSHGIYSIYMVCLFLFPLLGGVLPFALLWLLPKPCYPSLLPRNAWHCGIMTLTVGNCLQGVFEIYGTTAPLVLAYWTVGTGLLLLGLAGYFHQYHMARNGKDVPKRME